MTRRNALFLILLIWPWSHAAADTAHQVRLLMDQGCYQKAVNLLKTEAGGSNPWPERRTAATLALARFYEEKVGDYKRSRRLYRRAAALAEKNDLGMSMQEARAGLDRINRLFAVNADLVFELNRLKAGAFSPAPAASAQETRRIDERLTRLDRLSGSGGEDFCHEIFYLKGLYYTRQAKHFSAWRAFRSALAVKPALNLYQPVDRLAHSARGVWMRRLISRVAWGGAAMVMAVLFGGTLVARPWQWISHRHLAAILVVSGLWVLIFYSAIYLMGKNTRALAAVNRDGYYPGPTWVHTRPGDPGSEIIIILFKYGLVATAGTCCAAVVTGRMRRRGAASTLSLCLSLVLTFSLLTIFYLDHCDGKSRFYAASPSPMGRLKGTLGFRQQDPEPFLLIHPTRYQGLEPELVNDPELMVWLSGFKDGPSGPSNDNPDETP